MTIGAPLGQPNVRGTQTRGLFYLSRVYIDRGGYDTSGTYWGLGQPLYRYQRGDTSGYLRASSRDEAKSTVLREYPGATFYR